MVRKRVPYLKKIDIVSKINHQTQCIVKQIFVDDKAYEYFKTTDKFIYDYGMPCYIENKKIQLFNYDVTHLGQEVAKIINEFGISKIKTPKKTLPINN